MHEVLQPNLTKPNLVLVVKTKKKLPVSKYRNWLDPKIAIRYMKPDHDQSLHIISQIIIRELGK